MVKQINPMRVIRKIMALALVAMAFVACSSELKTDELAANTARAYYDYLLQGQYDDFVAGMDGYDEMPEGYRQQLADNARMYVAQIKKEHGGIERLRVMKAEVDNDTQTAQVYLVITFHDDLNEQILVPMVRRNGIWMMR